MCSVSDGLWEQEILEIFIKWGMPFENEIKKMLTRSHCDVYRYTHIHNSLHLYSFLTPLKKNCFSIVMIHFFYLCWSLHAYVFFVGS